MSEINNIQIKLFEEKQVRTLWDAPALTRKERADNVRKRNYWTKYGDQVSNVLNALLDKYAENRI